MKKQMLSISYLFQITPLNRAWLKFFTPHKILPVYKVLLYKEKSSLTLDTVDNWTLIKLSDVTNLRKLYLTVFKNIWFL